MGLIVSLQEPRSEWLPADFADGRHQLTVRDRIRMTHTQAKAMGMTWLSPYVPQYGREKVGHDRWRTNAKPQGFVRATAVRAMRLHFNDSASDPAKCGSVRVFALSKSWRLLDPAVKWADMGDLQAWPIAFRVDAQRLAARFEALALGTWCVDCDDMPWASTSHRCLWCEQLFFGTITVAPRVAAPAEGAAA